MAQSVSNVINFASAVIKEKKSHTTMQADKVFLPVFSICTTQQTSCLLPSRLPHSLKLHYMVGQGSFRLWNMRSDSAYLTTKVTLIEQNFVA